MPENHVVILCTVPDRESGERIGRILVEERLAACVNLTLGVLSVYRWQGAVRQEAECQLFIKTTAARYDALAARLRALHPYDVPEILALPVLRGDPAYLDWLTENSR
ncbi:MAG TPA: divalent-cation tolerance protein CutA [Gammaproteobacteria bacterium]|nr:divalent-cation tolerance protein CutA [Gammaproteobacteria bacterium]